MTRLVATGQPFIIILSIDSNVLIVTFRQLLNSLVYGLNAARFTHLFRGIVGVATGTIPVAFEWLRMEGDLDTPLLCDADKKVASHPKLVSHSDTLARPDLELPLGRHDFCVDTADPDASIEAGTVVGLNQVTCDDLPSACLLIEGTIDKRPLTMQMRSYQNRSSKVPEGQGNPLWATREAYRQGQGGCTPARDRTREWHLLLIPWS